MKGNYTLSTLFSKASGPFTVTLHTVMVKGNATLGVERDGQIRTQNVVMDMSFANMAMDFQNLGMSQPATVIVEIALVTGPMCHLQACSEVFSNRS